MKRRLYQLTIIVIGLFIIYGSSRNILELWQQKQRVWRIQKEVQELEVKEAELKKKLKYYNSDEYVEKMAREKLLLQKEGETVISLPQEQNQNGITNYQLPITNPDNADLSNWQKWLKLLGL